MCRPHLDPAREAEADTSVTGEMNREWPGGGARGRILRDAAGGSEHAALPAPPGPGEAIHPDHPAQLRERAEIGSQRGDVRLGGEADEDVPGTVVVELDRQLASLQPERREQRRLVVKRL